MERLRFQGLELEAFVHATESREKVEQALLRVAPGARVEREARTGHFGQPLLILRARLREPADDESFVTRLGAAAGPDLADTAARRIDDQLRIHARLDKQRAAAGEIALSSEPANDVIKLTAKIRAPGKGRAAVIAEFRKRFGGAPDGPASEDE
jgi:RNA binding exosome subunit